MRSVTVLGRDMLRHRHICVIYDSTSELYDVIIPYLKEGWLQREQLLTIMEDSQYPNYLTRLDAEGIWPDPGTQQLQAFRSSESYNGSAFNPREMLKMVQDTLANSKRLGFSSIRTCGDMNWSAAQGVDTDAVMRYEANVNSIVQDHDCTCMCVYDAKRFPASLILDVLATHPVVVMNGQICENPFYMSPSHFIPLMDSRQLRRRSEVQMP